MQLIYITSLIIIAPTTKPFLNPDHHMNTTTAPYATLASRAEPSARALFIRHTYSHLAGALLVFAGLCGLILQSSLPEQLIPLMVGSQYSWLIVMGIFMGVSWIANKWAMSDTSVGMQYLGLGLYTLAEALIITPLLYIASVNYPGVIQQAAVMTGALFIALTSIVFITRKDFSFMGPILSIAGIVAIGVIVSSILFGFNLGTLFSGLMILFAGGAILYDTSNVLHHYRTDQHVAASLSLFASVILLFWYILRLLMSLRD